MTKYSHLQISADRLKFNILPLEAWSSEDLGMLETLANVELQERAHRRAAIDLQGPGEDHEHA
jgi:hypothetical protein